MFAMEYSWAFPKSRFPSRKNPRTIHSLKLTPDRILGILSFCRTVDPVEARLLDDVIHLLLHVISINTRHVFAK